MFRDSYFVFVRGIHGVVCTVPCSVFRCSVNRREKGKGRGREVEEEEEKEVEEERGKKEEKASGKERSLVREDKLEATAHQRPLTAFEFGVRVWGLGVWVQVIQVS